MERVWLDVEGGVTYSVILTRVLEVKSSDGEPPDQRVILEIGVARNIESHEPIEGQAGFRISPLTDWQPIFGVDAIQATYFAIQIGEQEAERLGAGWPDDGAD